MRAFVRFIRHYFPIFRLIRVYSLRKKYSHRLRFDSYLSRRKKRIGFAIFYVCHQILSNYRIISTNKSRRLITRLHRCDKTGGGNAFDFASLIDRFRFPPAVTNFPGHSRQLLVTYERIRNGTASAFID